jgi:hypothetical protein
MGKQNPDLKTTRIGTEFPKAQVVKLHALVKREGTTLRAVIFQLVKEYAEKKGVKL